MADDAAEDDAADLVDDGTSDADDGATDADDGEARANEVDKAEAKKDGGAKDKRDRERRGGDPRRADLGGTSFRFEFDAQKIEIKCSSRESTQECVEAVMPLLETLVSPE